MVKDTNAPAAFAPPPLCTSPSTGGTTGLCGKGEQMTTCVCYGANELSKVANCMLRKKQLRMIVCVNIVHCTVCMHIFLPKDVRG